MNMMCLYVYKIFLGYLHALDNMQRMFAMGTVGSKILRTVFGLRELGN